MTDKKKPSLNPRLAETEIKHSIVVVREMPVILASDLAKFYDTETKFVNLYRKRNADKFTEDYAFQRGKF